jgi:hypothetical protein
MIINFKSIYKTKINKNTRPTRLPSVIISEEGLNCGAELVNVLYCQQQFGGTVTTGDILYLDEQGNNIFNGENGKYVISADNGITSYYVAVNTLGVITIIDICEAPLPRTLVNISAGFVSDTELGCGTVTNSFIRYIALTDENVVESGNVIYTNLSGSNITFNGGNLFYAIQVPLINKKYIVFINNEGEVNIIDLCL